MFFQGNLISPNGSSTHSLFCGPQGMRDKFPRNSWIHLCNGYIKGWCFIKNNRGNSLIGDVFISYDR